MKVSFPIFINVRRLFKFLNRSADDVFIPLYYQLKNSGRRRLSHILTVILNLCFRLSRFSASSIPGVIRCSETITMRSRVKGQQRGLVSTLDPRNRRVRRHQTCAHWLTC